MTAISGQNLVGSWLNSGPLGSLERTLLATSAWASMTCFLTWRDKVTPAGRLLFQLAPLVPTTVATDAGLLPTPVTFYSRENWTPEQIAERQAEIKAATNAKGKHHTGNGFGLNLAQAHRWWHTPRANDGEKRGALAPDDRSGLPAQVQHPKMWPTPNCSNDRTPAPAEAIKALTNTPRASGAKVTARLQDVVALMPTPTAAMHKGSSLGAMTRKTGKSRLRDRLDYATEQGDIASGRLNPSWVEWLMGFPTGWTDLKPSETQSSPKFQK